MISLAISEFSVAIRILVALVFLAAAVGKMRHWLAFQGVLANYRLLPEVLVKPVAYLLPPTEALIGVTLALEPGIPWVDAAAIGLLVVFAIAMGINLRRGRAHIDCGCFQSALKQHLSWTFVVRNLALALLLCIAAASGHPTEEPWMRVNGLLMGGVLFVILQALNLLWGIVPAWRYPPRLTAGGET